jgi:hypothetical protein
MLYAALQAESELAHVRAAAAEARTKLEDESLMLSRRFHAVSLPHPRAAGATSLRVGRSVTACPQALQRVASLRRRL